MTTKTTKTVTNGDNVTLHYKGTLEDGTEFDSSYERGEPMTVETGQGALIPGFENALIGMSEGETKTVTLAPEEAYGPRHEDRTTSVPREVFPDEIDLTEGAQVPLQAPDGTTFLATVTTSGDTNIDFDLNHPMAGKPLTFEVKVLTINV